MEKNVLIVSANLRSGNGVASCMMNYYGGMLDLGFHVDFLLQMEVASPLMERAKANGSEIFVFPRSTGKPDAGNRAFIKKVLAGKKYDIIHNNLNGYYGVFSLKTAKSAGVPVRIYHVHNPKDVTSAKARLRGRLYNPPCIKNSNVHLACSSLAGDSIFGRGGYEILPNAIDVNKYVFDPAARKKLRGELGIGDEFVIGTSCRHTMQKNPYFIIDIFEKYHALDPNSVLLWLGSGALMDSVRAYLEEKGLKNSVKMLGARSDADKLYSAMDFFLLPSRFEGLGMVFIEAQCSGLCCLASTAVPKDTELTGNISRIPLSLGAEEWAQRLLEAKKHLPERGDYSAAVRNGGYDINSGRSRLARLYEEKLTHR